MNMTMVLPDGSELVYDGLDIVPVGDRGLPQVVLHRRPAGGNQPAHEITITVTDGVPAVTEVRLIGADIRTKDIKLGGVGLDRLVSDWLVKVTYQPGAAAGEPEHDWIRKFPVSASARRSALRAVAQTRRAATDDFLHKVAAAYKAAPPPKHEAVALIFTVTPRTAQRYIEKARAAGLLPPSRKGGAR